MLTVEYKSGMWQAPKIQPYHNLNLSPAASSLHYGLQCFEGLKAYIDDDRKIRLFRPDMNVNRLKNSMERLHMPGYDFDMDQLIELLKILLKIDKRWIPDGDGYSLYIRPTVIATHPYLGLAAPSELLLYIITSPVGPYYPTGFKPIKLWATSEFVRAWPGGTGSNKVGGNYAPTMKPQADAVAKGCSQVLWLFQDQVTEVGSMNIFFVLENDDGNQTLVTPPLDRGDILPGVTRDSILHLSRIWHKSELKVEERFPTMAEILEASQSGNLVEAFGAGTAAVVTPISGIRYKEHNIEIPSTGRWTHQFWDDMTGIQYGHNEGPEGWSIIVD
jgi:branched-chain amino acid aminotransferase